MNDAADRTVMYIFVNKDLKMSPGKMAAQVAHAAVGAYAGTQDKAVAARWLLGSYAKLVMSARNAEQLLKIQKKLEAQGLDVFPVVDEGRTELRPSQFTALGVEIVDKADPKTEQIFKRYQLYQD